MLRENSLGGEISVRELRSKPLRRGQDHGGIASLADRVQELRGHISRGLAIQCVHRHATGMSGLPGKPGQVPAVIDQDGPVDGPYRVDQPAASSAEVGT